MLSGWGWRYRNGVAEFHHALDFAGEFTVLAAGDGHVQQNYWSDLFGWTVVIQHTRTLRTRYAHGARQSPRRVRSKITAGDPIYTSGSTGASTGKHLHFEVWVWTLTKGWHRVDPTPYLTAPKPPTNTLERKRRTWLG